MTSYEREPRPRRPKALYAIAGVVIVGAAAYLFWPRDEEAPTHVFTQDGFDDQRVQSVDDSQLVQDIGEAPREEASQPDQGLSEPQEQAASPIGSQSQTQPTYGEVVSADEASEVTDPPPAHLRELGAAGSNAAAEPTRPRAQRVGPTGMRTGPAPATGVPEPSATGPYQVWLGSFQSRDNAQRRVRELAGAGVQAEIIPVDTPNAGQVFRVRVGFFRDVNAARHFGDAMQRELDIQYWVDRR